MRRAILAFLSVLGLASPAFAADSADRTILGFSPDGAYFAFEQYGVQDGSGFPYATIFVIETATDSWVTGSPFSIRLEGENDTLEAARAQALAAATPMLTSLGIGVEGRLLVTNPFNEIAPDPHVQSFFATAWQPPPGQFFTLALADVPLPAAASCPPDLGYTYVGYALALSAPDGTARELHRDTRIPSSRACPIGYSFSDVVLFEREGDDVLIVILNLYQVGFEGPDRRFLGVATTIPQ
ncbi:MAG: DUF2259 domain-containing protein [Bauldia sp.]